MLRRSVVNGYDAVALHELSQLPGPSSYVPWSQSFAMRPAAVALLLREVALNRRRVIVELGSGVSTVFLARLLRNEGGHLYTVEDDEAWAAHVARWLEQEGTTDRVTLIRAPVEDGWYARKPLDAIPDGIDMLIVDGPKAGTDDIQLARYPALPYFSRKLTSDATVIADDIDRPGEQEVVARWEREYGRRFERRFLQDALAVSRPADAFQT